MSKLSANCREQGPSSWPPARWQTQTDICKQRQAHWDGEVGVPIKGDIEEKQEPLEDQPSLTCRNPAPHCPQDLQHGLVLRDRRPSAQGVTGEDPPAALLTL